MIIFEIIIVGLITLGYIYFFFTKAEKEQKAQIFNLPFDEKE